MRTVTDDSPFRYSVGENLIFILILKEHKNIPTLPNSIIFFLSIQNAFQNSSHRSNMMHFDSCHELNAPESHLMHSFSLVW